VVIDADQIARQVVAAGTGGLREVVAEFGPAVVSPDGTLDRAALATAVFDDGAARRRLEAIIHPRVRTLTAELIAAAPPDAVVVNDVPLLVEAGLAPTYHLVVVVEAAEEVRLARVMRRPGMSRAAARARIHAQASDVARRDAADVVFRNDGALGDLYAGVDALWHERLLPYEANVRLGRPAGRGASPAIVEHDPEWAAQYRRLAARVRHAAGSDTVRVDHIGATAVPELAAPDVIDIQLVGPDVAALDSLAPALDRAGFPRWRPDGGPETSLPDVPGVAATAIPAAWPRRLHGGADPARAVRLHLRPVGSPGWRAALLWRDWLRTWPDARAEVTGIRRAALATGESGDEDPAAVQAWFAGAWPRARAWAIHTGWTPGPVTPD
jgi:dephospho-CoA kinase